MSMSPIIPGWVVVLGIIIAIAAVALVVLVAFLVVRHLQRKKN